MKFNAIFNNSYRTTGKGKLMHVYAIQLPEDMSVADFHKKVSNISARSLCDNGQPRFNAWEEDLGDNPPNVINVWLTKDGRLSNLTAVNKAKEKEAVRTENAKNQVALLKEMGITKEYMLQQMGFANMASAVTNTTAPAQVPAQSTPVEEIDNVM